MTTVSGSVESVEMDIRGQICPSALLTTLRQINRRRQPLQQGAVRLVVLTDNRDATRTIPEAASNMGYEVQVVPGDGHYRITVQQGRPKG